MNQLVNFKRLGLILSFLILIVLIEGILIITI